MSHLGRVARNSLFLTVQPLVLNIISLFVLGFIARSLGEHSFGLFNFALSFTLIFQSIGRFGLNTTTVRDIAMDKVHTGDYFGKVLLIRFLLISIAYCVTVAAVTLMGYPMETRKVVYLFGLLVALDLSIEIITDVFRAHERMGAVSIINLISGLSLTILSVVVLLLGYGLYAVVLTYIAGKSLGLIAALAFYMKTFSVPRLSLDAAFWKETMAKGFPLFISSQLWLIISQVDVITLSKISTMAQIGLYTAASVLLTKLYVVPQAIASSVYPTISMLQKGEHEESKSLCSKIFFFTLLVSVPTAVGTVMTGGQIIELIYGPAYEGSSIILRVGIWIFPLMGLMLASVSILFATHQQNKVVAVYMAALPISIVAHILLINRFGILGASFAMLGAMAFQAVCLVYLVREYLAGLFGTTKFWRLVFANLLLGGVLVLIRDYNLFVIIAAAVLFYLAALRVLGIIMSEDIVKLRTIFAGNRA